jgi:hypothetical protein
MRSVDNVGIDQQQVLWRLSETFDPADTLTYRPQLIFVETATIADPAGW